MELLTIDYGSLPIIVLQRGFRNYELEDVVEDNNGDWYDIITINGKWYAVKGEI